MAKKIHSVVLKDLNIVEIDGEFREVYENEKKVPLFLTNHALRRGRDLGLIESSMMQDLLAMEPLVKGKKEDQAARDIVNEIPEEKMLNVIYLAYLGANPKSEDTMDDFLQRYHEDTASTMELYFEIVKSSVVNEDNKFAKSLQNSTKKPSPKEKK